MKEAKLVQVKVRDRYVELDKHLVASCELIASIIEGEREIVLANQFAHSNGYSELQLAQPTNRLDNLIEEARSQFSEHPSNFRIPGYYPMRHPKGPALGRMKDVKL